MVSYYSLGNRYFQQDRLHLSHGQIGYRLVGWKVCIINWPPRKTFKIQLGNFGISRRKMWKHFIQTSDVYWIMDSSSTCWKAITVEQTFTNVVNPCLVITEEDKLVSKLLSLIKWNFSLNNYIFIWYFICILKYCQLHVLIKSKKLQ